MKKKKWTAHHKHGKRFFSLIIAFCSLCFLFCYDCFVSFFTMTLNTLREDLVKICGFFFFLFKLKIKRIFRFDSFKSMFEWNLFFLIISGNWIAAWLTAWYKSIASKTLWASTNGSMLSCLTNCIAATLANAWINAWIIDTRTIVWTFAITLTFTADTMRKWISSVTRETGAN